MDFDQDGRRDQMRTTDRRERPQPEYRVSLTLAVTDPQALWTAAAAKLLCAVDMTLSDVLYVIGPREDPSITDCIAAMANPTAIPGCMLDDFWIDALRGCPPRIDMASAVADYKPASASADGSPRRAATKRRVGSHFALTLLPPIREDIPTN